jgi:hypothetical protein
VTDGPHCDRSIAILIHYDLDDLPAPVAKCVILYSSVDSLQSAHSSTSNHLIQQHRQWDLNILLFFPNA